MKKRNLIRLITLFLMFGMLLSTASAASQVQPRYAKIHTLTSELLSINWLGKATCCGTVDSLDPSCTLQLYVELQQSEDGVNGWSTIKSWSASATEYVSIEEYSYVASGYYYRVLTTAIVYSSDGAFIESDLAPSAVFYH